MESFRRDLTNWHLSHPAYAQRRLVLGSGSPCAATVFVGEAPGQQEETMGMPFVGKAGKNLDELLALAGIDRAACYITNVVKVRPTRLSPAGRTVNRPPTASEVADFLPWLTRELALVAPRRIVLLGNVPLKAFFGQAASVGQMHGRVTFYRETPMFSLYHPASLIYNRALRPVYETDVRSLGAWIRAQEESL